MELMHNKVIKLIAGPLFGLYRIILAERVESLIVLAKIDCKFQCKNAPDLLGICV
jgi:hypothetical protein